MNLPKIETSRFYLDCAIRKTNVELQRMVLKKGNHFHKIQYLEWQRIRLLREHLTKFLKSVTQNFPSLDKFNEFYTELLQATLDYDVLRKSLSRLNWAQQKIAQLTGEYEGKIRKSDTLTDVKKHRQACYGRISSIMKNLDEPLKHLEQSRKIMRTYPAIKEEFTIALAGFPNVGKSTLLSKLTPAKPEIKAYAFTTKQLNVGYFKQHPYTLQILDTPGTLARFEKMNVIEKQAYLAMKYASHMVVYVYDLSETSYPIKDQERLRQNLEKLDKPLLIYLNKTDLLSQQEMHAFLQKYPDALTSVEQLKKKLLEAIKEA